MRRYFTPLAVVFLAVSHVAAGTIDFEDLVLGQVYDLDPGTPAKPDTFVTSGVTVQLGEFFWLPSGSTTGGLARVENGGIAGGAGNELSVNNVNLDFDFGGPLSALTLQFGELGGNINFNVNGDFYNLDDFQMLPPTVGGVSVSVTPGSTPGEMKLLGPIHSFALGGQELWIDNLRFAQVPEPASGVLLLAGLVCVAGLRRRMGA